MLELALHRARAQPPPPTAAARASTSKGGNIVDDSSTDTDAGNTGLAHAAGGSGRPPFCAVSAAVVSPMEQHAVALVDEIDALLFHVDPRDSDSADGLGTTPPSASVPEQSGSACTGTRRDSWIARSRLRPTLLDRDSYAIAIAGGTGTGTDGPGIVPAAAAATATTAPVVPKEEVKAGAEAGAAARAGCSSANDAAADGVLAALASLWRLLSSRQAIDRINAKIGADVPAISGFEATSAKPPQDGDPAQNKNDAREPAADVGRHDSDRAHQGGKGRRVGVVDPTAAVAELTATVSAVLSVSAALLDNFTVLWFEVAETDVWSVYER